ncbi:MAG TPA: hypothetical protein VFF65_03240 [Phycisphaerales bacterium]|nr:hypothetical protein [Phycisphaerales bacterium]
MRLVTSLKPLALALAAGLMLSVFAAPTFAQGGRGGPGGGGGMGMGGGMFGGMGGGTNAPVSKGDIDKMAKSLKLTAEQQAAASALLDGHLAAFNKKAEEFRKVQEEAREAFRQDRDPAVFADMAPKMDEFRKFRAETEKKFMEDVKGVLDKSQLEQWPAYERSHKREQSMARGLMSGERADVIAIIERMKLPADKQAQVNPILDAYSVELDRVIDARNAVQDKAMANGGMFRGLMNPDGDNSEAMKKAEAILKEGREAATAVRDVNRKYAKQVEATLGGAEGEKFAAEFRKASFPNVYRERYIDRAITAAMAMDGIKAEQSEGLKALKEQYARDARPIDETAEKLAEENEASFSIANMMQRGGGQNDEKAQEQRRQRRELEEATLDKLKSILTPEQAAKLPERNQGGPGGGEGGQRRQRGGQNDGNNSGEAQPRRPRGGQGGGGAPRDNNPPAPRG